MTVQTSVQKPESVTMRVIEAVADAHDVDPIALTPPLGSVVDPDALETLANSESDTDVAVEFVYADCHVSVTSDDVVVHPRTDLE